MEVKIVGRHVFQPSNYTQISFASSVHRHHDATDNICLPNQACSSTSGSEPLVKSVVRLVVSCDWRRALIIADTPLVEELYSGTGK